MHVVVVLNLINTISKIDIGLESVQGPCWLFAPTKGFPNVFLLFLKYVLCHNKNSHEKG